MSEAPSEQRFDVVVIGSGPAGQKAAVQAAKAKASVVVIEEGAAVGGACVHRGTIPSKTLRETAVALGQLRRRSAGVLDVQPPEHLKLASLMTRLDQVVHAHQSFIADQLERNGIVHCHGRARFTSPHVVEVRSPDGTIRRASAKFGVIATEYACIFASLGVAVTMIDKSPRPLAFLDEELTNEVSRAFERQGGTYLGNRSAKQIVWDGLEVHTTLDNSHVVRTEKLLYCLGREANVHGLALENAGLGPTTRGLISVDAHCRTIVPHIYAVSYTHLR